MAVDYGRFGRALFHRVAAEILETLDEQGPASPKQLAERLRAPLGNVSYHVSVLAGLVPKGKPKFDPPLLILVGTEPRRGAVEHFYDLDPRARLPERTATWLQEQIESMQAEIEVMASEAAEAPQGAIA
jgi:hypothetical protein